MWETCVCHNCGESFIIRALQKQSQSAASPRLRRARLQRQRLVEVGASEIPLPAPEMDKSPAHQQGQARGVARVHLQAALEIVQRGDGVIPSQMDLAEQKARPGEVRALAEARHKRHSGLSQALLTEETDRLAQPGHEMIRLLRQQAIEIANGSGQVLSVEPIYSTEKQLKRILGRKLGRPLTRLVGFRFSAQAIEAISPPIMPESGFNPFRLIENRQSGARISVTENHQVGIEKGQLLSFKAPGGVVGNGQG
jgi:hypothetical protein